MPTKAEVIAQFEEASTGEELLEILDSLVPEESEI